MRSKIAYIGTIIRGIHTLGTCIEKLDCCNGSSKRSKSTENIFLLSYVKYRIVITLQIETHSSKILLSTKMLQGCLEGLSSSSIG